MMKKLLLASMLCLPLLGCMAQEPSPPLQADQQWVTGQLENGLTYHIYPDHHQAVSIRLYFHTGSLQESPTQAGYAHFVEHMAFNGSLHYAHNDVITMVQQAGASFGPDLNAYTTYQETVYTLDLPDNLAVDKALLWFRDIADGLTFSPQEVEKEKGVIMGEFRHRYREEKPLEQQYYEHLIATTDYAEHDVLGTKVQVQQATAQDLQAFYQQWYQPQLAEVVITGNLTLAQGEEWIQRYFSSWQKGTTPRPEPVKKRQQNLQDYVAHVATGEHASFSLLIGRGRHSMTTHEQLLDHRLDNIAEQLIDQRLKTVFRDSAQLHSQLYAMNYPVLDQRYTLIGSTFPYQQRSLVQELILSTLSSLRDFGVTQEELEAQLHPFKDDLQYAAQNKYDLLPNQHANHRIWAITNQQVLQSTLDFQYGLKQLLNTATIEQVNQRLKQLLNGDAAIIIGADKQENLEQLTDELSQLKKLRKRRGTQLNAADVDTILHQPTQPGEIITSQSIHSDPEIVQWQLENNVNVYLYRTYNNRNQLHLFYSRVGGIASLPSELYSAVDITPMVLTRSGIGSMDGSQVDSYMKRKNMSMQFIIDTTTHWLNINVNKPDLDDALALIHQYSTAPKVDNAQLAAVTQTQQENLRQFLTTPLGQFTNEINLASYSKDSYQQLRYLVDQPTPTRTQVLNVHQQLFKQGKFNLIIVGDIAPSDITPLLRQYIANIPLIAQPPVEINPHFKPSLVNRIEKTINTEDSAVVIHRYVSSDVSNQSAKKIFLEDMLHRLVNQKLLANIRESKGLDYTPMIYVINKDGEPYSDWLMIAHVAPANVAQTEQAFQEVITSLTQSISEEETQTVAKQLIVALKPIEDKPEQMAFMLNRYITHGYGFEALMNIEATAQSITAQEMHQRALQIFGDGSKKQISIMLPN
ncbi:insulinase family protein [Vibrio sp. 1-1(7)]|uniref:M16 family metallopeptidase n=2 Tax=unclassified Vibrio TaxID=2614977 RepID=UPI001483C7E9|nr:M16 family metallopeptidase [Vibrio sp. 12-2(3-a)]NNN43917.1 insulinase family protein [Vibrio sp. 1-1(7)]NNN71741.1 insulinase family protein [Vibrio sp. 12-2(3-a)]